MQRMLAGLGAWVLTAPRVGFAADLPPHASAVLVLLGSEVEPPCLNEPAIRAGVSSRLGYDPFARAKPDSIQVRLSAARVGAEWGATLQIQDGASFGKREVRAATCASLSANIELALALAIDPVATEKPVPAPVPAPVATASEAPSVERPPLPATLPGHMPRSAPLIPSRWTLGLGLSGEFGTLPEATAALRGRSFWHDGFGRVLGVECAWMVPTQTTLLEGALEARLVSATAFVGVEETTSERGSWAWSLLAAVNAGVLQVEGRGMPNPQNATAWMFGAGPRVQLAFALGKGRTAALFGEGLANLSQARFILADSTGARTLTAWESPAFSVRTGIVADFPFL